MSPSVRALIVIAGLAAATPGAFAQIEGRLFFSPQERALLDESRKRPDRAPPPAPEPSTTPPPQAKAPPPPPPPVTLNGVVRRNDGVTTVWLNDRAVTGQRAVAGVEVLTSSPASSAGRVTVRVPQSGRRVDMGVGQQLDLVNGEVRERYRMKPTDPSADADKPEAKPAAPRRATREREILRELLREIDGPSAPRAADATSPADPAGAPKPE